MRISATRVLACYFLLMLTCVSASAQEGSQQESDQLWHWYYVSPPYPIPDKSPLLRFGTARVAVADGKISISFVESAFPQMNPTFEGRVAESGDVIGELKNFFLEGPAWEAPGKFEESKYEKGCRLQQIMIRTGFADGTILMLSRVLGECDMDAGSDG